MIDDSFAIFSASLPLRQAENGGVIVHPEVRPWNGRALTVAEVMGAWAAAHFELKATGSFGLAAQAAFEFLSEHAW